MDRRYQVRGVLWLGIPALAVVTANGIIRHRRNNHDCGGTFQVHHISHGDVDRVQPVLQEQGAVG